MKKIKKFRLLNITFNKRKHGDLFPSILNDNDLFLSKNFISKTAIACLFFMTTSCSNDDINDIKTIKTNKVENKLTEAEMLSQGWKVVKKIDLSNDTVLTQKDTVIAQQRNRPKPKFKLIPLTKGHLKDLGYDIDNSTDKNKLKKIFSIGGVIADGIKFNNEICLDCDLRNPTRGANATIMIGDPIITYKTQNLDLPDNAYSTDVINYGNEVSKVKVNYSYQKGHKTTWKSTISTSVKLSTDISVGFLVAKKSIGFEFTLGGSIEHGTEDSSETTFNSEYEVTVPPRSRKTITILSKTKESSVEYFVPVRLIGWVQSNFPRPARRHYYWLTRIRNYSDLVSEVRGEKGIAKAVDNVSVSIIESPPKSL